MGPPLIMTCGDNDTINSTMTTASTITRTLILDASSSLSSWYKIQLLERMQEQIQDSDHSPVALRFENLNGGDPEISLALSKVWNEGKNHQIAMAMARNRHYHPLLEEITWIDCQGDLLETLLLPIQLDIVKQLTLYRVPLDALDDDTKDDDQDHDITSIFPKKLLEISHSQNHHLEQLKCEHCDIGGPEAKILSHVISNATHLKHLYLKGCLLETHCLPYFSTSLANNKSLVYLNLHWSNLNDDQISQLVTSLWHHPSLQELDLAGNLCRSKGIAALSKLLQYTSTLTRLRLREQCIDGGGGGDDDDDDEEIADVLLDLSPLISVIATGSNTSLKYLDVSVNKLTDKDISKLTLALVTNTTDGSSSSGYFGNGKIDCLDVRSNSITDVGVMQLSQYHSLRKLWLQDNPITYIGVKALTEAAKRSDSTLEYIGLSEAFDGLQDTLDYFTSLNWGGRWILQQPNAVSQSLWPWILERASKHDGMDRSANILYYLLRNGTVLWA